MISISVLPMLYFSKFMDAGFWLIPILLMGAFLSTAIGLFIFAIMGQHFKFSVVLIVLFVLCEATPEGSWIFGLVPWWGLIFGRSESRVPAFVFGRIIHHLIHYVVVRLLSNPG